MSSVPSSPVGDAGSKRLVQALDRIVPAYERWVELPLRNTGLTYTRVRVLTCLGRHGSHIMSVLSEELGLSPRTITALVDALEEGGLVRRVPHPTDRRAIIVKLTPDGTEMYERMHGQVNEAISELFSDLSEADQDDLLRLLNLVERALGDRGVLGQTS